MRRLQRLIGQSLVATALFTGLSLIATSSADVTAVEATSQGKRLVLFAPAGPVLIEVSVNTGSQTVEQIREEYARDLFTRLDADKSGKIESAEQANIPYLQSANRPASPDAVQKFLTEGVLTLEGLTGYINAQLGPTFSVVPKPPRSDQTVRLVDVLDRDGDAIVSLEEVVRSETALRRFDLDDDEALSVRELQPFPQSIRQSQRQQVAQARDALVVELSTDEVRKQVEDRIISDFAKGGEGVLLASCGLGSSAPAFDADSDGKLSKDEIGKWLAESNPEVNLKVTFRDDGRPPAVKAELAESDRVKPPEKASVRRWHAAIDGMDVQADATDRRALAGDSIKLTKQRFGISDNDNNDYLNEQEYGGLQLNAPFSSIDSNADGMLRIDEVEAFAKTQAQLSMSRIVLTVSDDVTSLYQLMDGDSNRRLTHRELASLAERLTPHDRNGNGRLDPNDFISKYRLAFAFSVPPGFDSFMPIQQPMNSNTMRPRATRVGPLWFQKMDRNRDIDVSWREFLGPRATFEKIDANHDGLIDKDEAEAATTGAGGEVVGER